MQILYVESNVSEAQRLEAMLRSEGHFCHTANGGRQAVVLAKRNNYDLVILDDMLPDIDGYEVIEQIHEAGIKTPFLIQSDPSGRNRTSERMGFGADHCLAKPFTRDELTQHIRRVLSRFPEGTSSKLDNGPYRQADPGVIGRERRRHRRLATLKSAEIIDGENLRPCIVLNLSDGGAGLRLPEKQAPARALFKLKLDSGLIHDCRICWRRGDKVGVSYVTAEDLKDVAGGRHRG